MLSAMPTTNPARISQAPSPQIGLGMKKPRLFRKVLKLRKFSPPSGTPSSMLSRGCGSTDSTPKYQKKMTSSGGMLRKIST